jgi:hypothetical protein
MTKSFIFFSLVVMFSSIVIAADLPKFEQYEDYASVRAKLIKAGWKPFHSLRADICSEKDLRCKGRPEMESCSGTGVGSCRFIWIRKGKKTAICTVGEDPAVFHSVCRP